MTAQRIGRPVVAALAATIIAVAACGRPATAPVAQESAARPGVAPAAGPGGIYLYSRPGKRAKPADAVQYRDVASGVLIGLRWDALEPEPGRFDFAEMDREVAAALAARKKISIGINAAAMSPAWVAQSGARTFAFAVARGPQRICSDWTLPLPWDAIYQRRYALMMSAVARHLKATPGAFAAVRIVKLSAIGRITSELRLPTGVGPRIECGQGDATARWFAAGYTPDRLVAAWLSGAKAVATAFPEVLLAQDVLQNNDLPRDAARGVTQDLKPRIFALGVATFGARFTVQWDGVSDTYPVADAPLLAKRMGASIGWQMNMLRGFDGSGCDAIRRRGAVLCGAADFTTMLDKGIVTGARYLEVWPEDAARHPAIVRAADARLAAFEPPDGLWSRR